MRFEFTQDYLTKNVSNWKTVLSYYVKKPNLEFLEVGSYEGQTAIWLLRNILNHKTSKITCIDNFPSAIREARFDKNILPFKKKVRKIKGFSQLVLRKLPLDHYDFIYIDASHGAPDVLEDGILAFRLLKNNGIMIFDDYKWHKSFAPHKRPKMGIDMFLKINEGKYELLLKGYQVILKKKELFQISPIKLSKLLTQAIQQIDQLPDAVIFFLTLLEGLLLRAYRVVYVKGLLTAYSFPKNLMCPCCGWQGRKFIAYRKRINVICPNCGSRERHRFLYLLLEKVFGQKKLDKNSKILYITQELLPFKNFLKNQYLSIGFSPEDALRAINLPGLTGFGDDYFDFIFIAHFLERVKKEKDFLTGVRRILKPKSGIAILCVPIDGRNQKTIEFTTKKTRNHPDKHVRQYGMDFFDRVRDAGFYVEIASSFLFPEKIRQKYAFLTEWVAICRKPQDE